MATGSRCDPWSEAPWAREAARTIRGVSTRRLIAVALLCGLAILVAGGIWLFQEGRAGDAGPSVPVLAVGMPATIGPMSVTLDQAEVGAGGQVVLHVRMEAVSAEVSDPARGWAVLSNRGPSLVDRADPQPAGGVPCLGVPLAKGATLSCSLYFNATAGQVSAGLQALYGRGSARAVWTIPS